MEKVYTTLNDEVAKQARQSIVWIDLPETIVTVSIIRIYRTEFMSVGIGTSLFLKAFFLPFCTAWPGRCNWISFCLYKRPSSFYFCSKAGKCIERNFRCIAFVASQSTHFKSIFLLMSRSTFFAPTNELRLSLVRYTFTKHLLASL